ncbi:MAG: class III poly(R)-hydroxyalkanoic acid synthase subunit PhaC [Desulfomonile tiedjei]|nr:class III poly(R)-hydroxyalkanoic acid synthase subunit PhaC [Desulfomonile tiedjei]
MTQSKIRVDLILASLAEDAEKAQEKVQKASDVFLEPLHTDIATTPYEVVYQEDRVKLKHYYPIAETRFKTPLLVVYALINRETMLDLQPGRSVVQTFLKSGIDLYMIDWGYPTRKDKFLTIDDHVNGYMDNVVDFVRKKHKVPTINLMGICMGGTFSVIYSALHPDKVKNLITTVTPTNFDTDEGLLHIWMRHLDVDRLVDAFGNMPGDMMNFGFLLLNPARLVIDKYVGFLEHMDDRSFVENFVRMEKWIFDSPDVPGETFRQFIKDLYQQNLLIKNRLEIGDRRVDLGKITMPVLNFYGSFDHLVPPGACELLTSRVGSTDTEDVRLDTGHIGIYVSGKCQKEFAPKIVKWLQQRDTAEIPEEKEIVMGGVAAQAEAVPAMI